MCIAVYKPLGAKMPSNKTLGTCFDKNSDGAGFMFPYNGKVHIEKGFMTFSAFKKGLKKSLKQYGLGTSEVPIVMHFRISTQGGVNKPLCHPYPLSDNYDDMKKLNIDSDFGIVHNGIITLTSDYRVTDHNDTMEYIKEIVYPLINNNKDYYNNKGLLDVMNYTLDGNRFLIMDGDGHVELLGSWVQDKGVYYSNSGYIAYNYKTTNLLSGGSWKKADSRLLYDSYEYYGGSRYDDYDDDYGYEEEAEEYNTYHELSVAQINEVYSKHELHCDKCGDELYYEWDDQLGCYVGYCLGCGKMFMLDDKDAEHLIEHGVIAEKEVYDDDKYYDRRLSYGGAK